MPPKKEQQQPPSPLDHIISLDPQVMASTLSSLSAEELDRALQAAIASGALVMSDEERALFNADPARAVAEGLRRLGEMDALQLAQMTSMYLQGILDGMLEASTTDSATSEATATTAGTFSDASRVPPGEPSIVEAIEAMMMRGTRAAVIMAPIGADATSESGPALLHVLRFGSIELVRAMVRDGASVGDASPSGVGALEQAALSGDMDKVMLVLALGKVRAPEAVSQKAFHDALWAAVGVPGNGEVIGYLVQLGAPINARVKNKTPLIAAVEAGRVENVRVLLDLGADDAPPGCVPALTALGPRFSGLSPSKLSNTVELAALLLEHHLGRPLGSFDDIYLASLSAVRTGRLPSVESVPVSTADMQKLHSLGSTNADEHIAVSLASQVAHHRGFDVNDEIVRAVMSRVAATTTDAAAPAPATPQPPPTDQPAGCYLWTKYGVCKYGSSCLFAHEESMRPANPPRAPFTPAAAGPRPSRDELEHLRALLEPHTVQGVFDT